MKKLDLEKSVVLGLSLTLEITTHTCAEKSPYTIHSFTYLPANRLDGTGKSSYLLLPSTKFDLY